MEEIFLKDKFDKNGRLIFKGGLHFRLINKTFEKK